MLAYYTRRENMHFAVVNKAWTTSKTPVTLLIIHFFCTIGLINDIVLIAVVQTSPGMPEPRVQWMQVHPMPFVFITFWVQCGCRLWVQCGCRLWVQRVHKRLKTNRFKSFHPNSSGVTEEEGALRHIWCGGPDDCCHCLTEILIYSY